MMQKIYDIQSFTLEEQYLLNTIICVDRSVCLVLPPDFVCLADPELKILGPTEYDFTKVELYLYEGQKDEKCIRGIRIYEHLKDINIINRCFGFEDVLEVQKKAIGVFQKFVGDKTIFFWKSVVMDRFGYFHVPCIQSDLGWIWIKWRRLDDYWFNDNPAACFAS
ncbi:MAG: hypothetical protein WCW87_01765 [Candidatus Paceibacterota bacterium]